MGRLDFLKKGALFPDLVQTVEEDTQVDEKEWLGEQLINLRTAFSAMVVVTIPLLTCLAVLNTARGRYMPALFLIGMDLILFWSFYSTRRGLPQEKEYGFYRSVMRGLLFIFLLYLMYDIGVEGRLSRLQWSYLFPIMAFLFLGKKEGLYWSAAFLIVVLSLTAFSNAEMAAGDFKLRYSMSMIALCMVAFSMEYALEVTYFRFVRQRRELRDSENRYREAFEGLRREMAGRQQIQQALAESEEKYRLIFEATFDVIYSIDRELRFTDVSPSMEKTLGYRPDELVGRSIQEVGILAEECIESAFRDIQIVFGGQSIPMRAYTVIAKDGSRRFAEISGAPLIRNGQVTGMISIGRDVTLQKRAEEELRRSHSELEVRVRERTAELEEAVTALRTANRAKSDFLANMSHEFRTPLNHILGFTELVVDKKFGGLNSTQEEYLTDVLHSSRHLLSLVNDVLDLSKVEAGKMELEISEVNLRRLLESSLVMVREKAMKHAIVLTIEGDSIPDRVPADERKLKQVMYNLLSNAVKFTPDGGAAAISARRVFAAGDRWPENGPETGVQHGSKRRLPRGEWVEVSVRDTGIGIAGDDLERIFEPFEQGDNSIGRKYQGTGLGLSLTRRLVELHGGVIRVESEGVGKGSTFRFILPLKRS